MLFRLYLKCVCSVLLGLVSLPANSTTTDPTSTQPLVIGPDLSWLTFLGGADSTDNGLTITTDSNDNIYIAGTSSDDWGTPLVSPTGNGGVLVAKLNSAGTLLWHTFLGNGRSSANSIAVDGSGNIWVTGHSFNTWGSPVAPHSVQRVASTLANPDIMVAKLDSNGALLWNTFHGVGNNIFGPETDIGYDIVVDSSGNGYVSGQSYGPWPAPVTKDGFSNLNNNYNMVVFKLDTDGALQWNAFYGDIAAQGKSIALHNDTSLYVTGSSLVTWGFPRNPYTAGPEIVVVKLSTAGNLIWNSFIGSTSPQEYSESIAVDVDGNAYIAGRGKAQFGENSVDPWSGGRDIIVAKMDSNGYLKWNTFLGSSLDDLIGSISLGSHSIYVAGHSNNTWGTPIVDHTPTVDIPTGLENYDGVVAELSYEGDLLRHTFLGSVKADQIRGSATDSNSDVIVIGISEATWGSPLNAYTGTELSPGEIFVNKVDFPVAPKIDVRGNKLRIDDGDTEPSFDDHTDFGDVDEAGVESFTRIFTIKNIGTADLNFDGVPKVVIGGTDAADFTVNLQPITPLTPSESTTFEIVFDPGALGLRTASVSISNDDPDENPYNFNIQGTGKPPLPEIRVTGGFSDIVNGSTNLSPHNKTQYTAIDIGSGDSNNQTYTILNEGSAELILDGAPRVTIGGQYPEDFTVVTQPSSPIAIESGSTTFEIKFELVSASSTSANSLKRATVSIANNDEDENPFTFDIGGVAVPNYSVGGTLSGLLEGNSIVLQNNTADDLFLDANGSFEFATRHRRFAPFNVTILTPPDNPEQDCVVTLGIGTVQNSDITFINVTCSIPGFGVGGTVTGLEGKGMVLQNNNGDDLIVDANGSFTFATRLDDSASYDVSILTPPVEPGQDCTITNGSGTIATADVSDIEVFCVTPDLIFGGLGGSMEDPETP